MKNKLGKLVFRFVLVCIFVFVVILIINDVVKSKAEQYVLTSETVEDDYDCILILGCGVRGNSPSLMLADRLSKGLELYQNGASQKLLMSGDHGKDDYDEVNVMKDFAIENGVASKDIFMDHAGFSTYESMYRAKEVFEADKILIVTQKYHLYRAVYDARALGLDAYGVAADEIAYAGQTYRDMREILSRNKDFFYTLFKPKPTYLGETIPVSGDGNTTNDK